MFQTSTLYTGGVSTHGNEAVVQGDGRVGGRAPGPEEVVVGIAAEVGRTVQCRVGEGRRVGVQVLVGGLSVPALAGVPRTGDGGCTAIVCPITRHTLWI